MNEDKCNLLAIFRQFNPLRVNYTMNGNDLAEINLMKDLGVVTDSKLRFNVQITEKIKKANRMLGFLKRTIKKFILLKPHLTPHYSIVRPILEYCSPVWNLYYSKYEEQIESVQKRFTRYIYRKFHYPYEPYETRLLRLNMKSLCDRRTTYNANTLYKIIHSRIEASLLCSIRMRYSNTNLSQYELCHVS